MKNGFSEDFAFNAPDDWRLAIAIILGEQEGGEFDWGAMKFKEQRQ